MQEFQKIKVSTDQNAVERELSVYEGRIEFYQNAINLIKVIIPDFVFESTDLKILFANTKAYLVDKIISEPTTIGGLELSKDKVFELLEHAENLKGVVSYIAGLKTHNRNNQSQSNLQSYTDYYEINPQNEVILKASTSEWLEDLHSVFAKNQRQKDAHDSLTIILQELNKLKTAYGRSHIKFIEENFEKNNEGDIRCIKYSYFHSLE